MSPVGFGYGSSPLTKKLDRVRPSVCQRTFHHSRKLEFLGANGSRPIENHQRRTANSIDGAALTARCDGAAHSNEKSGQNGWSGRMLRTCSGAKRVRKGIVEGLHQPSQNEPKTKSVGTRTNFAGRHVRTVQCGKMSPVASPGHGFGRDAACHVARLRRTAAAGKGGCGVGRGRLVTKRHRATGVRPGAAARIITARRRGARGPPRCSAAMHRRAASADG